MFPSASTTSLSADPMEASLISLDSLATYVLVSSVFFFLQLLSIYF